uniref:S1 motif domain-containing protein n=1 Tax=viral metagenome TaxID=1070528 RepID=A0A6C0KM91_9ZZZZ
MKASCNDRGGLGTMEQIAVFQEKVALSPIDLRADIRSFDDILLKKLKVQLEGKCSKNGYVIPGTLEILSRSLGFSEKGRGTADFLYYVKAQGKVYNPPDGLVVEGEVMLKNKMGCYVILDNAIRIMIPRDLHIGNEEFDSIELKDRIRIEIKKSQFRANATHILSIGQFLGKVGGDEVVGSAASAALAAEEESLQEEASEEEGGE